MRFAEGRAGEAAFVGLAAEEEVADAVGQRLVVIEDAEDVGADQRAVDTTDVHLAVLVDGHCTWNGADVERRVVLVGGRMILRLHIFEHIRRFWVSFEVVFDGYQILFHLWDVDDIISRFITNIDNGHNGGVAACNVAHEMRSAAEATGLGVVALSQIRNASLLYIGVEFKVIKAEELERLGVPK